MTEKQADEWLSKIEGKNRPKAEEGHDPSQGPTPRGRKAQVWGCRTWITRSLDKEGPVKVEDHMA